MNMVPLSNAIALTGLSRRVLLDMHYTDGVPALRTKGRHWRIDLDAVVAKTREKVRAAAVPAQAPRPELTPELQAKLEQAKLPKFPGAGRTRTSFPRKT